jgi:hypothetical protein
MEFNTSIITKLYGSTFYTLKPISVKQALANPAPPASPPATERITWHTRPTGILTLIISQTEKSDEYITMLKKMVDYIQMPVEYISFGFYTALLTEDDLRGMASPNGVFFGNVPAIPRQRVLELDGKKIYFLPFLTQIKQNKNLKIELVETMKTFLRQYT